MASAFPRAKGPWCSDQLSGAPGAGRAGQTLRSAAKLCTGLLRQGPALRGEGPILDKRGLAGTGPTGRGPDLNKRGLLF